jgi:hypothetical protein
MILLRFILTLNVWIHLNKIINWIVFHYILLIFYNSVQHNGDVSPESHCCSPTFEVLSVCHWNKSSPCTKSVRKVMYQSNYTDTLVIKKSKLFNHLTPNGHFSGCTAQLTYRCCIFFIYSTDINTEYFKHAAYSPCFPLQNVVYFIMLPFLFLYYSHFMYRVC